jgi:hypothetical protein
MDLLRMIPVVNLLVPPAGNPGPQQPQEPVTQVIHSVGSTGPKQTNGELIQAVVTDEAFLILMAIGGCLVTINLLTAK